MRPAEIVSALVVSFLAGSFSSRLWQMGSFDFTPSAIITSGFEFRSTPPTRSSSTPPTRSSDKLNDAIDIAMVTAASVEQRRQSTRLPAACFPGIDTEALAAESRSLTLVRTRVPELDEQFSLFIHPLTMDQYATQELLLRGLNHHATIRALRAILPLAARDEGAALGAARGPLVFDIGANIGFIALLCARLGARVIAIEPTRYHRALLEASAELGGFGARGAGDLTIVARALVEAPADVPGGEVCLGMEDKASKAPNAGATTLDPHARDCPAELRARVASLAQIVNEYGVPRVLKVDVEGFELSALRSGAHALARVPPLAFVYEYNSFSWADSPSAASLGWARPEGLAGCAAGLARCNARMADELIEFFFDGPLRTAAYELSDLHGDEERPARGRDAWRALLMREPERGWNTDLLLLRADFAARHAEELEPTFPLREQTDGRAVLAPGMHISTHRLVSNQGAVELRLRGGRLCAGPRNASFAAAEQGDHFLKNQDDGHLCVYAGSGPANNRGARWCHHEHCRGCVLRLTNDGEVRLGNRTLLRGRLSDGPPACMGPA